MDQSHKTFLASIRKWSHHEKTTDNDFYIVYSGFEKRGDTLKLDARYYEKGIAVASNGLQIWTARRHPEIHPDYGRFFFAFEAHKHHMDILKQTSKTKKMAKECVKAE